MAFLAISNGHSSHEVVKIKEGEVWKIDKYTTSLKDSNDLRQHNQKFYQQFQTRYPEGGRGSVSLFVSKAREYKEWFVFYEKHLVAFKHVLDDPNFLDYYIRTQRRRNLFSKDKSFYRSLRNKDSQLEGKLYFEVMRNVVYQYLQYCKDYPNVKSIDQLYDEYYRGISSVMINREEKEPDSDFVPYSDIDPDIVLYDQMDRVESRYSALEGFLCNPHFERVYQGVLVDGYFFLLGNSIESDEEKEIYQKWYHYAESGFDGTVVCPALFKNSSFLDKLASANITMFCIFRSDLEVERSISLAIFNGAEVIIELYNTSLYPRYAKKYPQATIVLCEPQNENQILDETDSFMIDCYNHAKEKRYYK